MTSDPNQHEIYNRLGIFQVPRKTLLAHPKVMLKLMSNLIIIRAHALFLPDAIEYHAFSLWFDPCALGATPKTYTLYSNGIDFMFNEEPQT